LTLFEVLISMIVFPAAQILLKWAPKSCSKGRLRRSTLVASSERDSWCASSSSAQQTACLSLLCQCHRAVCQ
jgi:hypothetical protein